MSKGEKALLVDARAFADTVAGAHHEVGRLAAAQTATGEALERLRSAVRQEPVLGE